MKRILWHNIPLLIELVIKLKPRRILDVNYDFEPWGMVLRELAEPEKPLDQGGDEIQLDGIGLSGEVRHHAAKRHYSAIHRPADAADFFNQIEVPYDVVILGDILNRLPKEEGRALLGQALAKAAYVLASSPINESLINYEEAKQGANGGPYCWTPQDYEKFPVARKLVMHDALGRLHSTMILSVEDPHKLGHTLNYNGVDSEVNQEFAGIYGEVRNVLNMIRETKYELEYVRNHPTYRLSQRLLHSPAWKALRWLNNRNRNMVTVRALGEQGPGSQGCEVWFVGAHHHVEAYPIPWDYIEVIGKNWQKKPMADGPYQHCYVATGEGSLRFPMDSKVGVLEFITHPWSGKVEVAFRDHTHVVDLYSERGGRIQVSPVSGRITEVVVLPGAEATPPTVIEPVSAGAAPNIKAGAWNTFTAEEKAWVKQMQAKRAGVLAVHVPRWLGITNSTRILFEHTLPFPKTANVEPYTISQAEIEQQANLILATGIKHVVCSGGDEIHYKMVRAIRHRDKSVRCDVLLHASYLHFAQDYNWKLMQYWVDGQKEGVVHTIGTVKKGMEEFFAAVGCRSKFVMNYLPQVPEGPSEPFPGGPHLGIWSSGENPLKPPYVMLAASRMIPGAVLHGSGLPPRVREVAEFFKIRFETYHGEQIPFKELIKLLARTHLNLYASFTECCPMLPLESFSVGTPCLIGPCSHLFEDHEYLAKRLIVPYPDRAEVIAQYIERALAERDQIVQTYRAYAQEYNRRARESVNAFLAD